MTKRNWSKTLQQASLLGLTVEQLALAKEQYNAQRKGSKRRLIDWNFTFESWVMWWRDQLGQNWQSKRGRRKTEYCMARKGDKGDYSNGNVECIFASQNVIDQKVNGTQPDSEAKSRLGERNGRSRLTDVMVSAIRHEYAKGSSLQKISSLYNISISTLHPAILGRTWGHLPGAVKSKGIGFRTDLRNGKL